MTSLIQDPLLWILLVVLVAAVVAVMRARRTNMALRRKNNDLQSVREAAQSERDRLYAEYTQLNAQHAGDLAAVRKDAEEDTKAVLKSAMRTLQVLADEQQLIIEKSQRRYGDDEQVLGDLMMIDHTNSQFGRRAQGIAVLCGGWLGRRETTASVFDVARSAQGRIKHFDRVTINTQVNVTVASRAVEPIAVVLAELLANATNYSAPGTRVDINIQAVPTGVCLIVDDAGLGMNTEEKARASVLLSPQAPVDITSLGDPPKFGFAVSGMLATRYGFKVSVDSVSPYGGVRAVILLPENLLTTDVPEPEGGADKAEPRAEVPVAPQRLTPVATPGGPQRPIGTTAGGLPKRRRRGSPVAVVPPPPEPAELHNEVTASRIGAFQRGTLLGRDTTTMEGPQDQ
ncbi:ATP-binding protein [Streptomyces sp. SID12501]|uniref:histidine kinase n=1 Tax=Streptomyces sp. SID12501 TaxID=2706042 RepID=A0A6B3BM49_9ACTN|nr:ATP-binding protein [Streptomyces sp. SID12501]NEC85562.1 sensor histidine kinase [Streptomyces sp. SID12501]